MHRRNGRLHPGIGRVPRVVALFDAQTRFLEPVLQ